ncbi:unnamed protein product, partial [Urochloa humidicola]
SPLIPRELLVAPILDPESSQWGGDDILLVLISAWGGSSLLPSLGGSPPRGRGDDEAPRAR